MERLNTPVVKNSVALDTTVIKLCESSTSVSDRQWLTFPVYSLAAVLYVHCVPPNDAAPSLATVQNYGTQFTSADKVVQMNLGENMDVYATLSTGTFTVYPTEWQ